MERGEAVWPKAGGKSGWIGRDSAGSGNQPLLPMAEWKVRMFQARATAWPRRGSVFSNKACTLGREKVN